LEVPELQSEALWLCLVVLVARQQAVPSQFCLEVALLQLLGPLPCQQLIVLVPVVPFVYFLALPPPTVAQSKQEQVTPRVQRLVK
jgi:hypothetical protein